MNVPLPTIRSRRRRSTRMLTALLPAVLAASATLGMPHAACGQDITVPVPVLPAASAQQITFRYRAVVNETTPIRVADVRSQVTTSADNAPATLGAEAVTTLQFIRFVLKSPIFLPWNGFLRMQNIAAVFNTGGTPMNVVATMINSEGAALSSTPFAIDANSELDILVNLLPGFLEDSVGVLKLELDQDSFDGNMFQYRFAIPAPLPAPQDPLEFMLGTPFENGIRGESFVTFNTIQPSGNPLDIPNEVTNWLTILNVDESPNSFLITFYDQSGNVFRTAALEVPAGGRRDLEAGHLDPGPGRVGLVRIEPSDTHAPYLAYQNRYGASAPQTALAKIIPFGIVSEARAGTRTTQWAPISTAGNGDNWVVIANTSPVAAGFRVNFLQNSGEPLGFIDLALNPFAQLHLSVNSVVPPNTSGVVQIASLEGGELIAESSVYFLDANRGVTAAYATIARPPLGSENHSSYNLFLSQFNFLKLFNAGPSPITATATFEQSGTAVGSTGMFLAPLSGFEIAVHELPFLAPTDTLGPFSVETTFADSLVADLLRFQMNPDGTIGAAQSLPLR